MHPSLDCWAMFTVEYPMAAAPEFSPVPGVYPTDQSISISTATEGALIYYTSMAGGTPPDPTVGDPGQLYTAPIDVTGPETSITIKTIAVPDQHLDSPDVKGTWAIGYVCEPPTFSPPGGVLVSPMDRVQISSATPGAQIAYRVEGPPAPSGSDPIGPVTMPSLVNPTHSGYTTTDYTISAIAHKPGWIDSTVASVTITMDFWTDCWAWDWDEVRDTIAMYQEFGLWYDPWYLGPEDRRVFLYETDQGNIGKMWIEDPFSWPFIRIRFTTWNPGGFVIAEGTEWWEPGYWFDLDSGLPVPGPDDLFLYKAFGPLDLEGYGAQWFSCIGFW